MLFLKSRQRILAAIVRNPGINVNNLSGLTGSQKNMKSLLDELENDNLVYSKHTANIRQLYPALQNRLACSVFELVENEQKKIIMSKFDAARKLSGRVGSFIKILGKNLVAIALFGSIARGHLTKTSDVDILFIVKKQNSNQKDKITRLSKAISLKINAEVSPILIEEKEFKRQLTEASSFARQVQKERIILYGISDFLLFGVAQFR